MYVCHCRVVNDTTIRSEIEAGAITPRQVAERCGAGATCGGCLPAIRQLLVAHGPRPCACPCPLVAAATRDHATASIASGTPDPVATPATAPLTPAAATA